MQMFPFLDHQRLKSYVLQFESNFVLKTLTTFHSFYMCLEYFGGRKSNQIVNLHFTIMLMHFQTLIIWLVPKPLFNVSLNVISSTPFSFWFFHLHSGLLSEAPKFSAFKIIKWRTHLSSNITIRRLINAFFQSVQIKLEGTRLPRKLYIIQID